MAKPIRVLLYYKYLPIENAEQFRWEGIYNKAILE